MRDNGAPRGEGGRGRSQRSEIRDRRWRSEAGNERQAGEVQKFERTDPARLEQRNGTASEACQHGLLDPDSSVLPPRPPARETRAPTSDSGFLASDIGCLTARSTRPRDSCRATSPSGRTFSAQRGLLSSTRPRSGQSHRERSNNPRGGVCWDATRSSTN